MFNNRRRMSQRYARRAKLDEAGVTIAFGFSSLWVAILSGILEELPYVGGFAGLAFFYFHRTVLVTDQHAYVYRDLPFHRPGEMLAMYPHGPDTVVRVRGKLTFADGTVVWHAPFFAWRVRQVAEAIGAGASTQTVTTY